MWLLLLLGCVAAAEGGGIGYDVCLRDPTDCDGVGLAHLAARDTWIYSIEGSWGLNLLGDVLRPRVASTGAAVLGRASLTRMSQCRLKIDLWNVSFSDWHEEVGVVETWVVVNGGRVDAVCVSPVSSSRQSAHLHALARSLASAALNVVPELSGQPVTAFEFDQHGQCATKYQLARTWPEGREVVRTKDLTTCGQSGATVRPLSILTDNATLSCHQLYRDDTGGEILHHIMCQQTLTLPSVAVMDSMLSLSLVQTHPLRPNSLGTDPLHELNLEIEVKSRISMPHQITRTYNILTQMCDELSQTVTSKAALLYPDLVEVLGHLEQERLMQLYQEINNGRTCPRHQRLGGVFSGALRDSSAPNAAAAKCSLITSGFVKSSSSWALSLGSVKQPTTEALHACAGLLTADYWDTSEVLGLAAMARHASCTGAGECSSLEAASRIAHRFSGKLNSCSEQEHQYQVLLAIRGLENMRQYGHEVEAGLRLCGGNAGATDSVRVAAIAALGWGPCSPQALNWLKWELLNETLSPELRITAFQSLRQCNEKEANAVATLITERDSNPQVKSYVSDFLSDSKTSQDVRQFSRHLLANLTALLGLPDTYLHTDVVFQDSFIPRSIGLNLSSPLLKHVGGSVQLGTRLENLEDLLQAVFGPKGMAGGNMEAWLVTLLEKVQQVFTTASQDFIQSHEREERSYSLKDVIHLLDRVQHDTVTELRGWISAGLGNQERLFHPYTVDPMAVHWEELITAWFDDLLEAAYFSLVNSNVELTTGWAEVEEQVLVWSVMGTPVEVWQQEGGLISLAASSKVDLLSLLTNPQASTLNTDLGPSMGVYSRLGMSVNSLPGRVVAATTTQAAVAVDVSAVLTLQGSDSVDLRVDLPHSSFHGYTIQVTHSLETPEDGHSNHKEERAHDTQNERDYTPSDVEDKNSTCFEDDTLAGSTGVGEGEKVLLTKQSCGRGLQAALGIKSGQVKQWIVGQHSTAVRSYGYLQKEEGITRYKIIFSWKNPGRRSLFLDTFIEAEGSDEEYRAGVVIGLTYGPHFTFKIQLHSREYSAFAEATLVNDPNLKRIDGHIGYQRTHYGLKAELLMVQDGGHISVKPRLVVGYPGIQEDALLEGYFACYFSDKVSSVTVDLYTEGSLKAYLDVAFKGTAEVKHAPDGTKTVTLKNVHFSSHNQSVGLESALALKDKEVEGRVQVTWGEQVVVMDGSIIILGGTGRVREDQLYQVSLQALLPSHPHLTTSIVCFTQIHDSQVVNNLTLTMGQEATQRELQVLHSTSWRVTQADSDHESHLPQIVTNHHGLTAEVNNKLWITSPDEDILWKIDHVLEVTERSVQNLITAVINEEHHIVKAGFYDQTEEMFKYHIELELNLASWYFSYVDTLEQLAGGEVSGLSTTIMPSGRVYTTASRYVMITEKAKFLVELHLDILIRDGSMSWNIIAQEVFDWTSSGINLEAIVKVGQVDFFGLEAALEGISLAQVDFHAKTWTKDLYEGEVSLESDNGKTNFSFSLLVIPFNQEIISRVALDHHQDTGGGKLDGELSWDARGDPASALSLSSTLQLPQVGSPLQISGSLSVLHWTWKTELMVVFGDEVGDVHKALFILILPDESRFETGSLMDLSFSQKDFSIMTGFYLHLPAGETHNLSVSAKGVQIPELSEASLSLEVDSPVCQEMHFLVQIIKEKMDDASNLDFKLQTHSEAKYWEAFSAEAKVKWDGSQIDGAVEVDLGDVAVMLNMSAFYEVTGKEHRLAASSEVRVPSLAAWNQLKSFIEGTLITGQNPSSVKVTQYSLVEKDHKEVFSSQGEVEVQVPEVNGKLSVFHAGNFASRQSYNLEGKFTGQEVEVRVLGTVDGEPVRVIVHYVHSKQMRVHANYRSEDYLSLSLTTRLQDFLISTVEEVGPAYSLSTEGQLVVLGQNTTMSHHLSISPSLASSVFKLAPFGGEDFLLRTTRTKLDLNHWCTDISLTWGQRIFTYHDEVNIPSLTGLSFRIEVDAPALLNSVVAVVVEAVEEAQGGQTVNLLLQEHNSTIHGARMLFYKYDTDGKRVWQAGATEVVVSSQRYQDIMLCHAIISLTAGLEVKSNMTVGDTPVVVMGVRVTPNIRALGLALCTTDEECVRVQVQARAQNTLSTRTFNISAHALNSLFWKDPYQPFIQNSVTLMAEETAERTLVSGGVQRLECKEVDCIASTPKGLLHTTLIITHNTLDVTVNTTHRIIALASMLRESQANEVPKTSLPGGILNYSTILENQLWLDRERDPQGAIKWTTCLAFYVSLRASEFALSSSLHHRSFTKGLGIEGSILLRDDSTTSLKVFLDIFTVSEDALKVDVELQHEGGGYILHGSLARARFIMKPLIDAIVMVMPSPDSSKFSFTVVLPVQTSSQLQATTSALQFRLLCGLDTLHSHTTFSCKVTTPLVYEKMSVGYQRWKTMGCVRGTASLDLLNHTYQLQHTSCHDPANLQITLSRNTEGQAKEELSLKLGVVDVHRAEVDLLGVTGLCVQLHPPFLLHVSAHHSHGVQSQWEHVMIRAHEEVEGLTVSAAGMVQNIMIDFRKMESLSIMSNSSPTTALTQHLYTQGIQLIQEVQHDQLLLDIIHSIQASTNITSIIVEAGFAYISHNYGEIFHEVVAGIRVWLETVAVNTGAWCVQLVGDIQQYLSDTLTLITNAPHLLLNQVLLVPLINESAEWVLAKLHLIQESTIYSFTRDSVTGITRILHKVMSFLYAKEAALLNKEDSEVWNIWIPLGECGHSLLEVWQYIKGTSKWVPHREFLSSTLFSWWHLLMHPLQLLHHISPPFPGEGAIIGDNNFITIDGRIFSLAPSCTHVLLTDSKQQLFTLLSHQQEATTGTNYTLLLGKITISVQSDLQVTINNVSVDLPHISRTLSVVRRLHELEVTARDGSGQDLVTLSCWSGQRACVVGVSGWFLADTRGLLGNFNLNPVDDFMRPSGKVALSRDVFSESWRLGSECSPERDIPMPSPHPRTQLLCHKFLLHYTASVIACHEAINVMPFYYTCLKYLTYVQDDEHEAQTEGDEKSNTLHDGEARSTAHSLSSPSVPPTIITSQTDMEAEETSKSYASNNTVYEISIKDVLFQLTEEKDFFTGVSLKEISKLCDVAAAYIASCSRHRIYVALPALCEKGKQPTYEESLSPEPQLDLVMLINENSCDSFIYQNLVRPLPQVLLRVAQGKNVSDIQIGVLGYGSGSGDVVYRTKGTSLLTPASELRVIRPPEEQRSQASLLDGMEAINKYPFRSGSVRIALVMRCDSHDIPKFTETLPKEMQRRRLALFTLTPDLLVFNPRRPKAVRNTIGMDRWRVYNLRLDHQNTSDSWGIRAPSSNIAQLAMKSGGGVFSLSALRSDDRAKYYMKLFRRVLSKAIMKVVVNAHRQRL